MEPQIKPSIKKQFLTKIYQRNLSSNPESDSGEKTPEVYYNPETSFMSNNSESNIQSLEVFSSPERVMKRSNTPGIQNRRSTTPLKTTHNMQVFIDFLNDLLSSNGIIPVSITKKIQSVTKALNDNFSKNPEFSLQFYISMTYIINTLENPDEINFTDFKQKIEEALSLTNEGTIEVEQLTILKKHISKVSLKVITVIINIDIKKTFINS